MTDPVEAVARAIFGDDFDAMRAEACNYCDQPNGQSAAVEYEEMLKTARRAIAALPGEPVAWAWERDWSEKGDWSRPMGRLNFERPEDCDRNRNIRPLYASPPLPSREAIANILFNERDPFRAAENILALFGARTGPEK